jgi:hypothetical protein
MRMNKINIYMQGNTLVYDKESPRNGGSHGFQHEFVLNYENAHIFH